MINSAAPEAEVCVDPAERLMIFSSRRQGGLGNFDLQVSQRQNGQWMSAKNLGAKINTDVSERAPLLSPNGQYLFFTSTRGIRSSVQENLPTYQKLLQRIRSVGNSSSDIYQIELKHLLELPPQGK